MKRFFALFIILCMVLCTYNLPSSYEFANSYLGKYCFYTTEDFSSSLTTKVKNGNGFIVCCDINDAKIVKKMLNTNLLFGESFSFCGNDDDVQNLLLNLDVFYCDKNEKEIIAYSPKIDYSFVLQGKEFNVQIAQNDGIIYVGFPTILGGF